MATRNRAVTLMGPHKMEVQDKGYPKLQGAPTDLNKKSLMAFIAFLVLFLVVCTTMATAQTNSDDSKRSDSAGHSALSASPDNKGQPQPQGPPGTLTTGSGGAAASDPQGGTPPDMQVNPGDELKAVHTSPTKR